MSVLGSGLSDAGQYEDAVSVGEALLSMMRRLGASEYNLLVVQGNLACTYEKLGRHDEALSLRREVYSARLKLDGEEYFETLAAANNYARSLNDVNRFEEARSLTRKLTPVARHVLGESRDLMFMIRWNYAEALYKDDNATLDNLREAVTTLEETTQTARRVLGGAHPLVKSIEDHLRNARTVLRARDTPSPGSA